MGFQILLSGYKLRASSGHFTNTENDSPKGGKQPWEMEKDRAGGREKGKEGGKGTELEERERGREIKVGGEREEERKRKREKQQPSDIFEPQ